MSWALFLLIMAAAMVCGGCAVEKGAVTVVVHCTLPSAAAVDAEDDGEEDDVQPVWAAGRWQ